MRDVQCLLDYTIVNIRTVNLDPEHLSEGFYLGSCPLDETFREKPFCRREPVQTTNKIAHCPLLRSP